MVIKITPQQAKRVDALLRKLCANYDGGNCLLLDDGEPCVCVQSISKYGTTATTSRMPCSQWTKSCTPR